MAIIPKVPKTKTKKSKSKPSKTKQDKVFRGKDKLQPGSRGGIIHG